MTYAEELRATYKAARRRLTVFRPEPALVRPKGLVIYDAPCGPKLPPLEAETAPEAEQPPATTFPLRAIILAVSAVTKVPVNDITSIRRHQPSVWARNIYYYAARKLSNKSFAYIGKYCGGKDHSTVMYGISRVEAAMDTYAPIIELVEMRLDAMNRICKSG